MTQDETWLAKYKEVVAFIETSKRNPSRYVAEERGRCLNWLKHNRKLYFSTHGDAVLNIIAGGSEAGEEICFWLKNARCKNDAAELTEDAIDELIDCYCTFFDRCWPFNQYHFLSIRRNGSRRVNGDTYFTVRKMMKLRLIEKKP